MTATPLDVQPNANTGSSGTTLSGPASGTLAQANEFVIGLFAQASATTPTTSTEDNINGTNAGGNASTSSAVGITRRSVNSTSTVTPQAVGAASGAYVAGTVSFKATNLTAAETTKLTNNDSDVAITLTPGGSLFTSITDSASYPSGSAIVGMKSTGAAPETYLYEAGVLFAFIGDPVPEIALLATPLALFVPKIIKSWQQGTLVADFKQLLRKLLKEVQKILTRSGVNKKYTNNSKGRKRKRKKRKVDKL